LELCHAGSHQLGEIFDFTLSSSPVQMDKDGVDIARIPLMNLALANRALSTASFPQATHELVEAAMTFFKDFIPVKAAWSHAILQADEAQAAVKHIEQTLNFAGSLQAVAPPSCVDSQSVDDACAHALDQVVHLARNGVALPSMFAEYVRQAIDSAGAHLLASAPPACPDARIMWSEEALKLQLIPVPHVVSALRSICQSLSSEELYDIGNATSQPCAEVVRLLAAIRWITDPKCRNTPGWIDVKLALMDTDLFIAGLQDWDPVTHCSVARINRARDLLLGCWQWAASGGDGSASLAILFAWASLVVAFLPILDMAQRLTPVLKAVTQAKLKSQKGPKNKQKQWKANAWASSLFLLDGTSERWWWLSLIRPSASMALPWTDCDDGGVTDQQGSIHDFDEEQLARSLQLDAQAQELDQALRRRQERNDQHHEQGGWHG